MVPLCQINFKESWDAHKADLSALLRIPSCYDGESVSPEAPYGRPVREALAYMKKLSDEAGFVTEEYENAAFSASWGSGERVDIVSHLDVVAVTDDWDEDPFSGAVHDGAVHGRGAQDMKSGAYLTFLAMKLAKDSGVCPRRELRLVYGSDEERTMDDMRLYVKHAGLPAFAFTPDGGFPMVNGEKGALMWTMEGATDAPVRSLRSGIQPNIIPPWAEAELEGISRAAAEAKMAELGICGNVTETNGVLTLRTEGKGAHASRPEEGHSATADLLRLLAELTSNAQLTRLADFFRSGYAEGTGLACELAPMGRLTLNPGVLNIENGRLFAQIDCRYPYGIGSDRLTAALAEAFPEFTVELPYDDHPTLVPEDDPYIRMMQEAYTESTGRPCPPAISGGVSYSKVFGHCVTFGTVGENSEFLMHQKNEKITEADCISALEIFTRTILKFAEAEI